MILFMIVGKWLAYSVSNRITKGVITYAIRLTCHSQHRNCNYTGNLFVSISITTMVRHRVQRIPRLVARETVV
jgi:hypothetical protein